MVFAVSGCATAPKGPTDEERIAATVDLWKTGLIAHDVDKVIGTFSDTFSHYEASDKATLKEMLAQAFEMGMGDDMAIDTEDTRTTIEEGEATVGPIRMTTVAGALSGDLVLTKEADGIWRITAVDVGY